MFLKKLIERNEAWNIYEEMSLYNVSKLENMFYYVIMQLKMAMRVSGIPINC